MYVLEILMSVLDSDECFLQSVVGFRLRHVLVAIGRANLNGVECREAYHLNGLYTGFRYR